MNLSERLKPGVLKIAGYLIPFVQSMPSLGVWIPLMTVPFISYLFFFFTALPDSLLGSFLNFGFWLFIIGLLPFAYSMVYLNIKKKEGLVTTGPYRLVRHPQYLILILLTMILTVWSYWLLTHTFGIGFFSAPVTIVVWFAELFSYIILAKIEELHLSKSLNASYEDYKNHVPFLIPLMKTSREYIDIILSVLLLAFVLFGFIFVTR
ncbi:MAG: methyltransferase family protein [Promethearchaeota archaeon]